MLSDIEIALSTKLDTIDVIAKKIGISSDELEPYGKYKAKLPLSEINKRQDNPDGKLVLVTAMNPTPAGEGKTTVSIGLAQALGKLDKKVMLALREPSLGPVFGVKGGAAGGGYSQLLPMEDINLNFTGDLHAITAANNLLAAMIDNHLYQGNSLNIDKDRILWKRCLDMNDRSLRTVTVGVGGGLSGVERNEVFSITAASEIMAILCLSTDPEDLKNRIKRIAIAYDMDGKLITADQLGAAGAMATLLKDAICPNLVQSIEHIPAFVHGGPFANISHGCNSIVATKAGLKLSDILITEAGFGADLGAEKFLDIKCRQAGIWPDAVVIVATARSLKHNAGVAKADLNKPNVEAVKTGFANLSKHIENMRTFGIPCVVAANRFITDTDEEIEIMRALCEEHGAKFAPCEIFAKGGEGGIELANAVLSQIESNTNKTPHFIYDLDMKPEDKINAIATTIYGAKEVNILPEAQSKIDEFTKAGYGKLPICIAKTQYSLSDNAKALGRPVNFTLTVRDVWLSAGAGYLVVLTGAIVTMPGLPPRPAAMDIDIDANGTISGLF
ncbi:MAG: formate--tetrahydrofolate ligase [Saccharofermentanaceae bacterium]|jgi:formate--tetrahydrofolate ligase|nr:formate--tetrahydrofolate ligase [Clostridia bacterium]NLX68474.1 formate--tetrahydrofolate ligase [Clostridiaceae bacterium]HOO48744.1 formate--tetrahydrofolate ligase [Saccharofermentans sp.]HPG63818.1 formate--tetrahydrofolate ligase [Saccharofermentans sp.]HPQ32050.1 formate--tetrahydrofolate ligase [Saccharofermentans sp.]